jgi:UDP:flavonoid glycosyltransferase YjiC (YdhE family)
MGVLISTRQGAGHFGPLVPFAHALLRDTAVVVPLFADQLHNARRVAEIGAGIAVAPDRLVRLPDAVRSLLAVRSYRANAGLIADEAQRLPTVDTATKIIRSLAAEA